MITVAGVSTQAGYKQVLNQFIYSEVATSKVEQWEKDAAETRTPQPLSNQKANHSLLEATDDTAINPTPRLNLTSAFHRLAKSSEIMRSLSLELDNRDKSEPASIDPPKFHPAPITHRTSSELTSSTMRRMGNSISSLRESITGSITINMNLKDELEASTQEESFMESFSSLNTSFRSTLEEEPRRRKRIV